MRFGAGYTPSIRSRFIDEIPEELLNTRADKVMDSFTREEKSVYSSKQNQATEFSRNDIVSHKLYGKGRVLSTTGHGENIRITVIFSGNVEKKFVQKYANLTLLK